MTELTISINSRPFQIICHDGEEAQVGRFADDLAARVAQLKKASLSAGDSHLLVLAGLTLMSELQEAQDALATAKQGMNEAVSARNKLDDRLNEFEASVAEALGETATRVEKLLAQKY